MEKLDKNEKRLILVAVITLLAIVGKFYGIDVLTEVDNTMDTVDAVEERVDRIEDKFTEVTDETR